MLLRAGDRGDAVRDVRARLIAANVAVSPGDVYDDATTEAVREFQRRRRLRVDGICGPETWGALIESGFLLGDRLLYLSGDMLRGDDVADLQHRLNALGFDAGREDGILGPATERAVRHFQRNAGITADGVCGPMTVRALERVSGLAAGSVATVRERERLRRDNRRIGEHRVFLAVDPTLSALAPAVARGLSGAGALVATDTSGADPSVITAEANRFRADLFVALAAGNEPGVRCAYFANANFRSESGYCIAERVTESLRPVLQHVGEPVGRTYRFLRETRMAAVVCELVDRHDVDATGTLVARLGDVAAAVVDGLRRGVEEPSASN